MSLIEWASAPFSGAPPIPFTTLTVSPENDAYAITDIPTDALADDLAALGLTYAPGRGNGYKLNGRPIDRDLLGDHIASVFTRAADALAAALDADPDFVEWRELDAAQRAHAGPRHAASCDSCQDRRLRLVTLRSFLIHSPESLVLMLRSLRATSVSIRRNAWARSAAIRRFGQSLYKSPTPTTSADVADFLANVPASIVTRQDLYAAAQAAGVALGPRQFYAAVNSDPRFSAFDSHGRRGWRVDPR